MNLKSLPFLVGLVCLAFLLSCNTPPPTLSPFVPSTPTRSIAIDTPIAVATIPSSTSTLTPSLPTAARVTSPTFTRVSATNTRSSSGRPSVTPAGAQNRANGLFDVLVMVDAQAPQTARADVVKVFNLASSTLAGKTNQWLRLVDIVYGVPRGKNIQEMVTGYLNSHSSDPPDGVLVFSNDQNAHTYGGYSFVVKPSFSFANEFRSPRSEVAGDKIYIGVVEYDHPYARCGYNDAGDHVSNVSIDGECRNRPGTKCVQQGSRWTCANAVDDLYSKPDYFTASTIVHEFLHPFGIDANENYDHYGTPTCTQRTGMTASAAADTILFQQNVGLCPDVFARFHK